MNRLVSIALSLLVVLAAIVGVSYWLVASGRWTPANPSEAAYPIRGIDVSRHQGTIDWDAVAASGVDFVYMKATEGGDWTDPEFARNWSEAGRVGIARGAYHFFTFCRDAGEQAAHALRVLPPEAELPFVVDVEYGGNCEGFESTDVVSRSLDAFMAASTAELGYPPAIYAVHSSYPDFIERRYLESPLWLQNIIWTPSAEGDRDWAIWQYSVSGTVPGIEGPVDLNVFNGDRDAFDAFHLSN